jgi:hypothetical protein
MKLNNLNHLIEILQPYSPSGNCRSLSMEPFRVFSPTLMTLKIVTVHKTHSDGFSNLTRNKELQTSCTRGKQIGTDCMPSKFITRKESVKKAVLICLSLGLSSVYSGIEAHYWFIWADEHHYVFKGKLHKETTERYILRILIHWSKIIDHTVRLL